MTRTDLLVRVVKAVADADGVSSEELPPLHNYIDPEILHKLDDPETAGDWQFTFRFADHQVTVTHDAQVFVDGELYHTEQHL